MMLRVAKLLTSVGLLGGIGGGGTLALDHYEIIDMTDYPFFRAARTTIATTQIILDYKFSLLSLDPETTENYDEIKSQVHTRAAQTMLNLCWRNRGTYVKIGQHLGGMDYLLPEEYCKELKILHSNAPQSSLEEMYQVIKEELEIDNISEVFSHFNPKPIGTASLAQVYKAKLRKNGQTVAVKVQHPKLRDQSAKDMDMMDDSVKMVARLFPDFEFTWIAEETRSNLPLELDFLHEVENCEKATENLKNFDWVKLPKIFHEYCTPRLLIMEFLEGGQVNDAGYMHRNNINFKQVAKMLGKLFSEMIFVHGFVHSDPHPGNILVRWKQDDNTSFLSRILPFNNKKLELVLLDHGLYRQLSEDFRFNYACLWNAIINQNIEGIKKYATALNSGEMYPLLATIVTGRSWEVIEKQGIKNQNFTEKEDEEIKDGAVTYLTGISQILANIPREMLLILKTNDQLRGLEHFYGTRGHASGFIDMSKCCLRALHDLELNRISPYQPWYSRSYIAFQHGLQLHVGLLKIMLFECWMWISSIGQSDPPAPVTNAVMNTSQSSTSNKKSSSSSNNLQSNNNVFSFNNNAQGA